MRAPVKPFLALALFAVLGLAAAGCGGTKEVIVVEVRTAPATPEYSGSSPTSTWTFPNVHTGAFVTCEGGPRRAEVAVPPLGETVNAAESTVTGHKGKTAGSMSMQISVKHLSDGSISVTCRHFHH
jgi:hypothetical protein